VLIGVIADDFTGASDIANTLAKGVPGQGGLVTAQ
jgi:3-dehydrotetronate 4-kinase